MGNGYLEAVYQECLALELDSLGIPFEEFKQLDLNYKTQQLKQKYQPDFVCFNSIIVEIKAVKNISDEHRSQILNYLKATNIQLGLLINFGHHPKVQYER